MELSFLWKDLKYLEPVERGLRKVLVVERDKIVEVAKTAYDDGQGQFTCKKRERWRTEK